MRNKKYVFFFLFMAGLSSKWILKYLYTKKKGANRMRTSPIIELKNSLISDEDYIKYEEIYKNDRIVDTDLLVKLLDKYFDLYYVFLKINIFLYRYDTKGLNKELQDFLHYKGKVYHIDDLDSMIRLYYRNYNRCQIAMKKVITKKLRPIKERKLLQQILDRPIEKEITPLYEYEECMRNETDN